MLSASFVMLIAAKHLAPHATDPFAALRVTTWGKDFLHRKVTDRGTFGYTIEDLYHILFSVLSLLTLR